MIELFRGQLLAFDPEGVMALMIPIIALLIPIVAILIKHQQRMAEIIHGSAQLQQPVSNETAALREEMQQIRQQMTQMALALDDVKQALPKDEVRSRIQEAKS